MVARWLRASEPGELDLLESGRYDGAAFGAEFCHRRLPRARDVGEARARCRDRGLAFSLVTPVVREGAFDAVAGWLAGLAADLAGDEWVANDWGLLAWARAQGLPLRAVAGRLLGRQRRDARVLAMRRGAPASDADALRGSLWDDPKSCAWLQALGVERVELDLLLQGARRPALPPGMGLTLCAPWLPVTLSPSCPWSADPLACSGPCRGAEPVVLRNAEDPHPLWSRGNTLFHRVEGTAEEAGAAAGALGADRLVWAEALPG